MSERWYAQLSAGQNECIHHAIAEQDNDIIPGDIDEEGLHPGELV